jgi:hypothetical protein
MTQVMLTAVAMTAMLSTALALAAESSSIPTCGGWNRMHERERVMFISGYSLGAQIGAAVGQAHTDKGNKFGDEILESLLPSEISDRCHRFTSRRIL